ncbi:hypothetical protein BsWGS_21288 [Bradybaena similaris]
MPNSAKRCLYILLVMALLWLTEVLPIPITALLPLVMFPMASVMKASETSQAYISDTSMLFIGGLIVAVAVEESNLHKRIAMLVFMLIGSDPKWMMAGLMLPTWFLSMWISNTATAAMMIPIAEAVLLQIKSVNEENLTELQDSNDHSSSDPENSISENINSSSHDGLKEDKGVLNPVFISDISATETVTTERESKMKTDAGSEEEPESPIQKKASKSEDSGYLRLCRGLTLCIAYASNIGGIATLTGTAPNLILKGNADRFYQSAQARNGTEQTGSPISFSNWMVLALPMSALTLVLGWLLLVIFFISGRGCCTYKKRQALAIKKLVRDEWRKLGKFTLAEVEVLILFVCLAILWISRDPGESPGWGRWFSKDYVSDSTAAMLISVLLFMLPAKLPNLFCWYKEERSLEPVWKPLLTWEQVNRKLPWGVIILLGGGFALAKGVEKSHLDKWLAHKLEGLGSLDGWVLNLVLCLIVATVTEVTSNSATAALLMPILANLGISVGISPLYLMTSSAIATSFAFMLPVATPPNAIVFTYGYIRVVDMASVGFFMNIIAVAVLTLAVNTWGKFVYNFDEIEPYFQKSSP